MRLTTPLLLIFCSGLMACSSYTEDLASEAFEPIIPDEEVNKSFSIAHKLVQCNLDHDNLN